MAKTKTFTYGIPINESVDGGTVTVLSVQITDSSPKRRGAKLRRLLQQNYNLTRKQAKAALRAMGFDTIII